MAVWRLLRSWSWNAGAGRRRVGGQRTAPFRSRIGSVCARALTHPLILSFGDLAIDSGSMLTAKIARKFGRPCRHVIVPDYGEIKGIALERVRGWLRENDIRILNVAGPRDSREPGIQLAARRALVLILAP